MGGLGKRKPGLRLVNEPAHVPEPKTIGGPEARNVQRGSELPPAPTQVIVAKPEFGSP